MCQSDKDINNKYENGKSSSNTSEIKEYAE